MAYSSATLLPGQSQALFNSTARATYVGIVSNPRPFSPDLYVSLTLGLCASLATLIVLLRILTKLFIIRTTDKEDCEFMPAARLKVQCRHLQILDAISLARVGLHVAEYPFEKLKSKAEPCWIYHTTWNRRQYQRRISHVGHTP